MRYEPCGRRVLARTVESSASALVAPDGTVARKEKYFLVVAVGPEVTAYKPGDRIALDKNSDRTGIPGEPGLFLASEGDVALRLVDAEPAQDSTVGAMH